MHVKESGGASLSIVQLIVWGISDKLPKIVSSPLVFFLNIIGKLADKIIYSPVFTINYSVFAIK